MPQESGGHTILLSAQTASGGQRRMALGVSVLLFAAVVATLPFARIQGPSVPAFILVLHTIMAINDLITAVLLFGQYCIECSPRVNLLAGGYLFTSLISIPYLLAFPGMFSAGTVLKTTPDSAPWLYVAWHGVLSLAIIGYGLLPARTGEERRKTGQRASIVFMVVIVLGAVGALTALASLGRDWLPSIGVGDRYSTVALIAIDMLVLLALAAALIIARCRPYTVLDLWMIVVAFAWLCSVTLGAFIGTVRYEIGFDVSRGFAVLASTFVLAVLLSEVSALYGRAISERERRLNELEAVLIHLSRVNELGQHVSSLIHEVNQPLTAIANYVAASIQMLDKSAPERAKALLERLSEQAERASGIVRHLRDFIARHETERRTESVPDMLRDAVRLALTGAGQPGPALEIRCDPAAATAFFDRVQAEQVVFNLVRNAAEAMAEMPRRILTLATGLTADGMVEVSVADTGPGLSSEIRARLFEPFVTTKAGGLGIGLSICRVIVEAHGGRLQVDENPGGGTVFRFTLPRSADFDCGGEAPAGPPARPL